MHIYTFVILYRKVRITGDPAKTAYCITYFSLQFQGRRQGGAEGAAATKKKRREGRGREKERRKRNQKRKEIEPVIAACQEHVVMGHQWPPDSPAAPKPLTVTAPAFRATRQPPFCKILPTPLLSILYKLMVCMLFLKFYKPTFCNSFTLLICCLLLSLLPFLNQEIKKVY